MWSLEILWHTAFLELINILKNGTSTGTTSFYVLKNMSNVHMCLSLHICLGSLVLTSGIFIAGEIKFKSQLRN